MSAGYTPGPWTNHGRIAGAPGIPHSAIAATTLLARVYATNYGDTEQETANARLIAAAPQLAEALLAILAESDTIACGRLMSDAFAHGRAALTAAGVTHDAEARQAALRG